MELPKPKNWQDFETIVRDAMAQRWNSATLSKNGRPGQKQHGVDIYGPDDIGRPVGIQCKRYAKPLKLAEVKNEIANAEKFIGQLTTLYVATTADHDSQLQADVRLLSDSRAAQGHFAVSMLYWDEIVAGLLLNPVLFKAHYPQLTPAGHQTTDRERLIGLLELGYYGVDLWEQVKLAYGEFGWMAQADPDEFIARLRVVEQRARQLLEPDDAAPIVASIAEVRSGCAAPAEKKTSSDWDPVEIHAKRVSNRIGAATSLLPLTESRMLELAIQLGRIYHHADNVPLPALRKTVEAKVRSVLPSASEDAITRAFKLPRTLRSGYGWAMRIYTLLHHELKAG
jgi:hypothetical protein